MPPAPRSQLRARAGILFPMQSLTTFISRFEPVLKTVLSTHAEGTLSTPKEVRALASYVPTLTFAGGKRIRPFMAWTMYCAGGGTDERILRTLTSLELFHVFALIHDDLIDQGTLRHGKATAHIAYAQPPFSLPPRTAESTALLVGDLVFSWADRAWDDVPHSVDGAARAQAVAAYRTMIDEVVAGQILDVTLTASTTADLETVMRKTELKTASYTFVRPMHIGAALAGAPHLIPFCEAFGLAVGRAFQTQDDLLDILAPSTQTAKTAFSDVREGQHTALTAHVFAHGTPSHKDALRAAMGRPDLQTEDIETLRRVFEDSGALVAATASITEDLTLARRTIDDADLPPETQAILRELCDHLASRTT